LSPWTLGGRLAGQHLANDAGASYGYNARGLLGWMESDDVDQVWYGAFGGPCQSGMIRYDASGNRKQMGVTGSLSDSVVHPGNVYYQYNTKDQLTNETSTRVGGALNQGFDYDDAFNPTTLRSTGSLPYNENNQRTGSQTYVYDGNGNPTTYKGSTLT